MNQTELQWDDDEAPAVPEPVGYLRIAPSAFGQKVSADTMYWLRGLKVLYDLKDGLLIIDRDITVNLPEGY